MLVGAGHVGPTVCVDVRDVRVLRKMTVEVGEGRRDVANRHRVEFDGVDVLGVVVERGQDLVSTGRPDDGLLSRRLPEDPERQGARVVGVVVPRQEGPGAVPPIDRRSEDPVVVEVVDVGMARSPGEVHA